MNKLSRATTIASLVGSMGLVAVAMAGEKHEGSSRQKGLGSGAKSTVTVPVLENAATVTVSGTVDDIDHKNHKLVLKNNEGERVDIQVAPDVVGFDKLKKGDPVDVTYYESMAVALVPSAPGAAEPVVREHALATKHKVGPNVVAREIAASIPLTDVDAQKGAIEFKAPDGSTRTVNVTDPKMKEGLKALKPGDIVAVTFTQAVSTAVMPSTR